MFKGIFESGDRTNRNLVGMLSEHEQSINKSESMTRLHKAERKLREAYAEGLYGPLTYEKINRKDYVQGGNDKRVFHIESGEAQLIYEEMERTKQIRKGHINFMGKEPIRI